jgi:hypothetical protein
VNLFKYYSDLRTEILEVVTGVENSSGSSFFWDDTTPNWATKSKLEKLYARCLVGAAKYGLYVVTRHCDCPNPKHSEYPVSHNYRLEVKYRDGDYIWNGGQMYQGSRHCVCPCSIKNSATNHPVIDAVIYSRNADQELCSRLEDVLSDINESIVCAGEKKSRSAIRENLLRAVLRINDQLLPEPMDSYIRQKLVSNV